MLNWVTEHFPDFEENDKMTKFMDWFEERLIEDVSELLASYVVCLLLSHG